jgi:hypothetical protein
MDIVFQYYFIVKDIAYMSLTQCKGNQEFLFLVGMLGTSR